MATGVAPEKSSVGIIVSIIVIVLVLSAGAYYFLKQVPTSTDLNSQDQTPVVTTPADVDVVTSTLSTQGTSTDIADIQADLNSTDLTGLDAGLSDIAI